MKLTLCLPSTTILRAQAVVKSARTKTVRSWLVTKAVCAPRMVEASGVLTIHAATQQSAQRHAAVHMVCGMYV
jgi:hypothetical protein